MSTTGLIAEKARANIAMIHFGNKEGLCEEQMGRPMDAAFLENLATFNGRLFSAGLAPTSQET